MASITTYCNSFKLELVTGVHNLSTDTIMAALYTSDANLGANTTHYSTDGEVSGPGYTAGGVTASVLTGYPAIVGNGVEVRFGAISWVSTTITYRTLLLYNASKSNRAIVVYDRGMDLSTVSGPVIVSDAPPSTPLIMIP